MTNTQRTSIEWIQGYLQNTVSPAEFWQALIHDSALEAYLSMPCHLPPFTVEHANIYYYLVTLNPLSLGCLIESQCVLQKFLAQHNVMVPETSSQLQEFSRVLLSALPRWLEMVPGEYALQLYEQEIEHGMVPTKKSLQERLKKDFKYLRKPPKWLQTGLWPMGKEAPMIFIEQVDVSALHHDTAMLYVFYDSVARRYFTFTQSC